MRIVRFEAIDGTGPVRFGELEGQVIHELDGAPYAEAKRTGRRYQRQVVRLRTPVELSKIIGIGLNYRDHAVEHHTDVPKEPLIFFKAPSALIGPDDAIVLPEDIGTVDLEGELVVVLRRQTRHVNPQDAAECILG